MKAAFYPFVRIYKRSSQAFLQRVPCPRRRLRLLVTRPRGKSDFSKRLEATHLPLKENCYALYHKIRSADEKGCANLVRPQASIQALSAGRSL